MEHSSSRAICSKVSHSTSLHWNVRAVFLFGSALMSFTHSVDLSQPSGPARRLRLSGVLGSSRASAARAHGAQGLFGASPPVFGASPPGFGSSFFFAASAARSLMAGTTQSVTYSPRVLMSRSSRSFGSDSFGT